MTPLIEEQLAAFLIECQDAWHVCPTPTIADAGAGDADYWNRVLPTWAYVALGETTAVGTVVDAYDLAQVDLCVSALPRRYPVVVSCDLLEHVLDPFAVSRNIIRSLEPGGYLYVTTVFAFEHHDYPIDMWRFTTTALGHLFSGQPPWSVEVERCWYAPETPFEGFGNRWRVSLIGRRA